MKNKYRKFDFVLTDGTNEKRGSKKLLDEYRGNY